MKKRLIFATLTLAGALVGANAAWAQVAGATTTIGVSVSESTQVALGWSVKKTLMGKTIYNDLGTKVGKVEDLIISPERNVSYVIVGAGGFVGIGRHDVAVPVSQIQNRSGRLVMAGATKDTIKSLPAFEYANDTARRDEFIAAAEKDIANAKTKVSDLDKAAGTATADMKAKIDAHTMTLKAEMKTAEGKLSEMKMATVKRWREFEASVNAATGRLRKSTDKSLA